MDGHHLSVNPIKSFYRYIPIKSEDRLPVKLLLKLLLISQSLQNVVPCGCGFPIRKRVFRDTKPNSAEYKNAYFLARESK